MEPCIINEQTPTGIEVVHEYCLDAELKVTPEGSGVDTSEYTIELADDGGVVVNAGTVKDVDPT